MCVVPFGVRTHLSSGIINLVLVPLKNVHSLAQTRARTHTRMTRSHSFENGQKTNEGNNAISCELLTG